MLYEFGTMVSIELMEKFTMCKRSGVSTPDIFKKDRTL